MTSASVSAQAEGTWPVYTESGRVQGAAPDANGVTSFKGIPYAAPPVGPLRWRSPQPMPFWGGVRQANDFGAPCWATTFPGTAPDPAQSEDCLTLNVWTPVPRFGSGKPVMVWLHGGGFTFSSTRDPTFDGSNLATRDVVVVTLNYRLNAFGFLAHPALDREAGSSGAYGLQDQIAALRWVRRNIAAFGGDPNNITLFGESAGAHSIGMLMASPQARGLFDKAIAQSGAFWDSEHGSLSTHAEALTRGSRLAAQFNANDAASLRAVAAEQLNAATQWNITTDPGLTVFTPSVDGQVLPESPSTVFYKGNQAPIPLLGGWNGREDYPIFGIRGLPSTTPQAFVTAATQQFGVNQINRFSDIFPSRNTDETLASANALAGDLCIIEQTWEMLVLQSRLRQSPTYAYYFTYTSPYSPIAAHNADPVFVFGNLIPQFFAPLAPAPTEADRQLSNLIMDYWTNFAKQGNPNGSSLPFWPTYDGPGSTVMQLSNTTAAGPEVGTDRFRFISSFRRNGRLPDFWRTINLPN